MSGGDPAVMPWMGLCGRCPWFSTRPHGSSLVYRDIWSITHLESEKPSVKSAMRVFLTPFNLFMDEKGPCFWLDLPTGMQFTSVEGLLARPERRRYETHPLSSFGGFSWTFCVEHAEAVRLHGSAIHSGILEFMKNCCPYYTEHFISSCQQCDPGRKKNAPAQA